MRTMRTVFAGTVVFLTNLSVAWAGGIEFPTLGTEALGRGGAFVATADDGTAAYHNPAGFAMQRGTRLTLGASLIGMDLSFRRAGSYSGGAYNGQPFPTVSNSGDPTVAPNLAFSTDFGGALQRGTVYIAAFPPSGNGKLQFPEQVSLPNGMTAPAPQRYDVTQKGAVVAYGVIGGAYRLTDDLDVGGGFWWGYGAFDLRTIAVVPGACATAEDPNCDVPVDLHTTDNFAPSGNFGMLWHPTDAFAMGASVRLPVSLVGNGRARIHMPGGPAEGQSAYAALHLDEPLMLQAGARVRPSAHSDIEVDVGWENWSRLQNVEVDVVQVGVDRSPAMIPHDFRDTLTFRMGGEIGSESFIMRGGMFYDQGAAPDSVSRLDFAAFDKVGATAGLGIPIGSLRLDAAFAYVYQLPRDVVTSLVMPQNALHPDQAPGGYRAVGAGHYESSIKMLAVSLTARLD